MMNRIAIQEQKIIEETNKIQRTIMQNPSKGYNDELLSKVNKQLKQIQEFREKKQLQLIQQSNKEFGFQVKQMTGTK